jgi:sugar lactone lactonase YvrE
MATLGDRLYVADATSVVVIDIGKRAVERRLRMPGARLLHGIAADPGGDLYVSDFLRNAIYRVARGEVPEVFIASRRLESPTALAIQGPHLIVATWGVITDPSTLTTRTPGRLLRVKLGSKDISPIADRPLGHLDGLQVSDGAYLVSDRLAGKLLRISPEGTVTLVRGGLRGPAGLGLNPQRGIVAVPEREANNVVFLSLK